MEERRSTPRAESRMLCRLRSGIRSHSGMVLDVSTNGVFIQTTASLSPGTPLSLTMYAPDARRFVLEGEVARVVVAPTGLKAGAGCGLGVVLRDAPKAYVGWVESLVGRVGEPLRVSSAPVAGPKAAPETARPFQVRLREIGGNGTREVLVRCGSEAEAAELALAEFDVNWKVMGVDAE